MQKNGEGLNVKCFNMRLEVELRVYYGPFQEKMLSDFSVDLGVGGLYLKTNFTFEVDEYLTLKFSLPGQEEQAVSCRARVAWVNPEKNQCKPKLPPGVGVQFINLTPEDLASIVSFLAVEAAW
jgi:uncharacterized protein (TIGR02266 family)